MSAGSVRFLRAEGVDIIDCRIERDRRKVVESLWLCRAASSGLLHGYLHGSNLILGAKQLALSVDHKMGRGKMVNSLRKLTFQKTVLSNQHDRLVPF